MTRHQTDMLEYLLKPYDAWGHAHRQGRKLEAGIAALARKLGVSKRDAAYEALAIGRARHQLAGKTIYISNIGSSGSHWLQAIISRMNPTLDCGEAYIAGSFRKTLASYSPEQRDAALQAIYFLHDFKNNPEISTATYTASAINTAHVATLDKIYMPMRDKAVKVLLVRNPVDVVISRTFRKDEYRNYLGHGSASDAEYLLENIKTVLRFFDAIQKDDFDMICHYEKLRSQDVTEARMIIEETWGSCDLGKLKNVIAELSYENTRNKRDLKTGVFTGEKKAVPPSIRERSMEYLSELLEEYDYL